MWPIKAREYQHTTKMLRRMVKQARATFTPMQFTRGAIEAMGDWYWACHPRVVLKLETAESLKAKFDAEQDLAGEYVPDGALEGPFDAEQTMPRSLIEAYMVAVAGGQLGGTPAEVEQARRILAANNHPAGSDVQGRAPVPDQPQVSPVVRPRDRKDDDD